MIVAHLTDLHLNGTSDRRGRVIRSLEAAQSAGARHLLLTGDLTAYGTGAQVAELEGVLSQHWRPSLGLGKTVVPGNHDGRGPIDKTFPLHGPVDLDGALLVPVDTRFHRRALAFRALGAIGKDTLAGLELASRDPGRPVVVAMHHGPHGRTLGLFEGTVGKEGLGALMQKRSHIHVCCGHDHAQFDRGNIHAAHAVAHHDKPLRLYEVGRDGFRVI
jgi:3',5'-cyclic AMP phosphodiesterase CpdA